MNQIINENSMDIPKKKNVILIWVLSLITFGIYPYFWFINRSQELNNLQTTSKLKKSTTVISIILYFLILGLFIGTAITAQVLNKDLTTIKDIKDVPLQYQILFGILIFLFIIQVILFLFVTFRARKILNESLVNKKIKRKVSWFFTLIFSFLYLQYEINRIIDNKEMDKRIGPWVWFLVLYIIPIITAIILSVLSINIFTTLSNANPFS